MRKRMTIHIVMMRPEYGVRIDMISFGNTAICGSEWRCVAEMSSVTPLAMPDIVRRRGSSERFQAVGIERIADKGRWASAIPLSVPLQC